MPTFAEAKHLVFSTDYCHPKMTLYVSDNNNTTSNEIQKAAIEQ